MNGAHTNEHSQLQGLGITNGAKATSPIVLSPDSERFPSPVMMDSFPGKTTSNGTSIDDAHPSVNQAQTLPNQFAKESQLPQGQTITQPAQVVGRPPNQKDIGFQAYAHQQTQQPPAAIITQPPLAPMVTQPSSNLPHNVSPVMRSPLPVAQSDCYSFTVKDKQPVTVQIAREYAMHLWRFTSPHSGISRVLTTLDILQHTASHLTRSELDKALRDTSYLQNLGRGVFEVLIRSQSQNGQQQNRAISQPVPHPAVSRINRDPHHLSGRHASNGTIQAAGSSSSSITTPIQSPKTAAAINVADRPEITSIQESWNEEMQGVEQMFGQAWEQMRKVSSNAFIKMNVTLTAAQSNNESDKAIAQLQTQMIDEQKKNALLQSSVLRLTDSESKARSDLDEIGQKLQAEVYRRATAEHAHTQLHCRFSQSMANMQQAKDRSDQLIQTSNAKILELTDTLKTQMENSSTAEKTRHERLTAAHNAEISRLKTELEEAKISRPAFGHPSVTSSPKSPKSPADPNSEIAKLRSLLKQKNTKFNELEERHNQDMEEIKSNIGKDPKVWENEVRQKAIETAEKETRRLKKKVEDLEAEQKINKESLSESTLRDALEKIVRCAEGLQKLYNRPSDAQSSNKPLLDRANMLFKDLLVVVEKVESQDEERKKLEGQVELLKIQLTAAESAKSSSMTSESEFEELKSAFKNIISYGHNIQTLMGRPVDQNLEDENPSVQAHQFQKSMQAVFDEINKKTPGKEQDEEKRKELQIKVQELETSLAANMKTMLSKETELQATVKGLEETKNKLSEAEKKVSSMAEEMEKQMTSLDDLKAEYQVDLQTGEKDSSATKEEHAQLINERDSLIEQVEKQKEAFNTLRDELKAEKESLLVQINDQKEEIERLEEELEVEQGKVDTAESAMREAMDKQYEQKDNFDSMENELRELKEQRNRWKEDAKRLESELQSAPKAKPASKDDDATQAIPGPGPSSSASRRRPSTYVHTSTSIPHGASQSPALKPSTLSQSSRPPSTSINAQPLFLPNEEAEESQTPPTSLGLSVVRSKKRRRVADVGDDDDVSPEPDASKSKAPSVAPSATDSTVSILAYKPVTTKWIEKNMKIFILEKNGTSICKLCFVNQRKAAPPERAKQMTVDETKPLKAGISKEGLLTHVSSHGETLRRLKNKRVKEGKEPASP
ncbi:uncharacterized protein IL334_006616 [Kwoniella shivajii]|uniref:Uncharacterized protein n=1 Tax=Kwoniella shivajii TaxID=564305 RepID=A0ABZ1DAC2_9TREE|nr:hypothetical protein IL334_006616 [Kwoniella shivajii]